MRRKLSAVHRSAALRPAEPTPRPSRSGSASQATWAASRDAEKAGRQLCQGRPRRELEWRQRIDALACRAEVDAQRRVRGRPLALHHVGRLVALEGEVGVLPVVRQLPDQAWQSARGDIARLIQPIALAKLPGMSRRRPPPSRVLASAPRPDRARRFRAVIAHYRVRFSLSKSAKRFRSVRSSQTDRSVRECGRGRSRAPSQPRDCRMLRPLHESGDELRDTGCRPAGPRCRATRRGWRGSPNNCPSAGGVSRGSSTRNTSKHRVNHDRRAASPIRRSILKSLAAAARGGTIVVCMRIGCQYLHKTTSTSTRTAHRCLCLVQRNRGASSRPAGIPSRDV